MFHSFCATLYHNMNQKRQELFVTFNEVETLVRPMESPSTAARAKVICFIVPLEGPRFLERRPYLESETVNNSWRDNALYNKKIAGDFVLIRIDLERQRPRWNIR